jgi:hypothetical protein
LGVKEVKPMDKFLSAYDGLAEYFAGAFCTIFVSAVIAGWDYWTAVREFWGPLW